MHVDTVVPAAGRSVRMNMFKPLLPFGESTVIETIVDNAIPFSKRVIVVVGFKADQIIKLKSWNKRVLFIRNDNYDLGMFSSIKAGVEKVNTKRFFVTLGDQPHISTQIYQRLLEATDNNFIAPEYSGRLGHPVLLSEYVKRRILSADISSTLKDVLKSFKPVTVAVDDKGVLFDMDTQSDYKRLSKIVK